MAEEEMSTFAITPGVATMFEGFRRWVEMQWLEWQNEHEKEGMTSKDFYEFLDDRMLNFLSLVKEV